MPSLLSACTGMHHHPIKLIEPIERIKLPIYPQLFVIGISRPDDNWPSGPNTTYHCTTKGRYLKTKFDEKLSDIIDAPTGISLAAAEQLFQYVQNCPVFKWQGSNNDCEDRANALCMLLDKWQVPNYKGWVFSGYYLGRGLGSLRNFWNYHVAAVVPVLVDGSTRFYVLDPSIFTTLQPIAVWAGTVTDYPESYYLIKHSQYYIFPSAAIGRDNWHKRDRRNFKWTMQGLAGINGVSKTGKAQLVFNKARVRKAEAEFKRLLNQPPAIQAHK